jgi:Barstar (barnase inhibitor)
MNKRTSTHGNQIQNSLSHVKQNIVQSIRAFTTKELVQVAEQLGQHFLFANLATAQNKQEIIECLVTQFTLAKEMTKNFDVLQQNLTDVLNRSGRQLGFIMILEHIPVSVKFDRDVREQLLDTFRDIAEYWSDKGVPCRVFYSFAVARSAAVMSENEVFAEVDGEKMPTDKIFDVSPFALRMSSPFNPDYWLTAA